MPNQGSFSRKMAVLGEEEEREEVVDRKEEPRSKKGRKVSSCLKKSRIVGQIMVRPVSGTF